MDEMVNLNQNRSKAVIIFREKKKTKGRGAGRDQRIRTAMCWAGPDRRPCTAGGGSGRAGPISCMHPSDLDLTACDGIFLDDPKNPAALMTPTTGKGRRLTVRAVGDGGDYKGCCGGLGTLGLARSNSQVGSRPTAWSGRAPRPRKESSDDSDLPAVFVNTEREERSGGGIGVQEKESREGRGREEAAVLSTTSCNSTSLARSSPLAGDERKQTSAYMLLPEREE
jgi:hypothetical protein